jgi:hypothetical protein
MATSPNQFKYRYFYNGDTLYGNTIDDVANSLVKASKNTSSPYSFSSAVVEVSKRMIPIHKSLVEQSFPKKVKSEAPSLQEIAAGATSALKQIGGICEDQAVINRRAIICSACPKKSDTSGCGPCGFAGKVKNFVNSVKKMFGGGHTIPNELDKSYCECCDCSLAMMLPAQLKDFKEKTINDPERPKTCWIVMASSGVTTLGGKA